MSSIKHSFVAVDIGNNRIKFGCFDAQRGIAIPEPLRTLGLYADEPELSAIAPWLETGTPFRWAIASVNQPVTTKLTEWIKQHRPADAVAVLTASDLPLEVRLARPDLVGIDRLINAMAVNRLREAGRPAIVVDVGTAITVDLVSSDGAFCGGAILPGIQMAVRALHEFTELLPLVDAASLSSPPGLGIDTQSAIESGVFWGAVGAVRELVERLGATEHGEHASNCPPEVFITGGAGGVVAQAIGPSARYVPDLTLAGIALARLIHE